MTDDLVKRLRGTYSTGPFGERSFEPYIPPISKEAADRIEALEVENARLREAGLVPDGYVVVPKEPTEGMLSDDTYIQVGCCGITEKEKVELWELMIAASQEDA